MLRLLSFILVFDASDRPSPSSPSRNGSGGDIEDDAPLPPLGLQPPVRTFWGEYYDGEERDPTQTEPAPWVLEFHRRRAQRKRRQWDDKGEKVLARPYGWKGD